MILIKYNNQNITTLAKSGKWQHPETGVKYPSNWDFSAIEGVTIETPPDPEPYAPTQAEIEAQNEYLRLEAYRNESDPLFFKYQRGEIDKQVWLDKVEEIKTRYL